MEVTGVIDRSNVRETTGAVYVNNVEIDGNGKVDCVIIKKTTPVWRAIAQANDGETFLAKGRIEDGDRGPKFIVSTIYLGHDRIQEDRVSVDTNAVVSTIGLVDIGAKLEAIFVRLNVSNPAKGLIGDLLFEMGHPNHSIPETF